jgi:HAD superfamily hydrolase (TIGR01509 family)
MFTQKKVIIFDMDGTLIDSVGVWNAVDRELIKLLGHKEIDEAKIQQQRDEILRTLSHSKDAYLEYCEFLKQTYKASYSKEEIRNLRYEIATTYMIDVIDFKADAEHFLHYLKHKGFTLVIASTTSDANLKTYMTLNQKMTEKVDFKEMFALVLGRDVVSKIKPDPEIHHFIMEKLQVSPQECLMIEDSLIGLEAAHNAGIDAVIMYDKYSDTDRIELERRALASFKTYQDVLEYTQKELDFLY